MQPKISLELCLKLMGLEALVETEEKSLDQKNELCTFEEIESKTTYDEKSSYYLSLRKKQNGKEATHQLVVEIERKKITAHHIYIEEDCYPLSNFNDEFQEYQYIKHQTDTIGEFYLEDDILFYEIGKVNQENMTDTLGGGRNFVRTIHTLKDMEETEKELGTVKLGQSQEKNYVYSMK